MSENEAKGKVERVARTDRWVMYRRCEVKEDGRRIIYYSFEDVKKADTKQSLDLEEPGV
ncbi:MAG: hypothetical protein ACP5R4_03915 [Armatimonadota bacterium]